MNAVLLRKFSQLELYGLHVKLAHVLQKEKVITKAPCFSTGEREKREE